MKLLVLLLLAAVAAGCASTFDGVCAMKPAGQARGIAYAYVHCEAAQ